MLKRFITNKYWLFLSYIFHSLLLAVTGLYLPWLVKTFIEDLGAHPFEGLNQTIVLKILVCAFIIYYAYRKMLITIGNFVEINIYKFRTDILKKIINAPFHEAKKNDFSSLAHHMIQDINGIEKNLIQFLNFAVFHGMIVIGIFGIMLSIDWMLFCTVVFFFGISVFVINFMGKNIEYTGFRSQKALLKTFTKIQDIFKGLQSIKIYGIERKQIQKLNILNRDYYSKTVEFIQKEAMIKPFDYLLEIIGIGIILLIGGILVQQGKITIAYLFSFVLYIELLGEPASRLSSYIIAYRNIKNFLNRLSGLIKNVSTMKKSYFSAEQELDEIKKISMQHLSFYYARTKRFIIKDLSLEVKKGDIVGICGKNGSGKTTLVELLLGFLRPISGEILVNDINLFTLKEKNWRNKITLMPQKPYFFEDSLRNNLTLFNSKIDESTLEAMISLVGAEHIIANLPDGLATVIATHRIGLSGGELQKLSMIRVLLLNPEVIILDEPFNHLDIQSCENLKEVILKIAKNKIIFIIEHHHEIIDEIATKTILLGAPKGA